MKREKIFEITLEKDEDEELFWEGLERACERRGWKIWDLTDMETSWYALPSSAHDGHGIGVQEIIVKDKKTGEELTLARVTEFFYGTRYETVYFIVEED